VLALNVSLAGWLLGLPGLGVQVVYLGIENIHVVRDSLQRLREFLDTHGGATSDGVVSLLVSGPASHRRAPAPSPAPIASPGLSVPVAAGLLTGAVWSSRGCPLGLREGVHRMGRGFCECRWVRLPLPLWLSLLACRGVAAPRGRGVP